MTAKTVAIGAALVLVGVLVGLNVPMAEAQRDGPYALSAGAVRSVWRMNVRTGQVSFCGSFSGTETPPGKRPVCSPWGPAKGR